MTTYALDPASDRPAYKQIADQFRSAIQSGELEPGAQLPSEAELIDQFGVAQGTVRRALDLLRSEGVIESHQGRGVFVRVQPPIQRQSGNRLRRSFRESGKGAAYDADAEAAGFTPSVELYFVGQIEAPDEVAERLAVSAGTPVLARRRRYLSDGRPTQISTSHVPWSLAEGTPMTERNTGPGGLYARIEELGHRITLFKEEVSARMPTPEESKALALPPGVPVVRVVRTAYSDDRPVEVADTVMASGLWVLEYEIPGD